MTEWSEKFAAVGRYYDNLVARHGHSPFACDYGRPESQQIKFSVLAEVMPLSGKSILDVGCGFADYADYLEQKFTRVSYSGVDLSAAMVEGARKHRPDRSIRRLDILQDEPGRYDVVTANGIFYLLGSKAAPLMRRIVTRMFELSREAVAFNSLSAWAVDHEAGEFYADPLQTVDFCRTLTPWVVLRHDYHHRDFTIFMYRERRG